jgi:hypothetical protein
MTDAATAERPWLGLTEAAELTGLDREALRSRARRGLLPSRKGNRGQLLIQVPADLADGHDHADDRDDRGADRDLAGMRAAMTDLSAEVGELRVALARAEADRDAAKAIATAELAAKDQVIAELRTMLAELRRPWWRRWRTS